MAISFNQMANKRRKKMFRLLAFRIEIDQKVALCQIEKW